MVMDKSGDKQLRHLNICSKKTPSVNCTSTAQLNQRILRLKASNLASSKSIRKLKRENQNLKKNLGKFLTSCQIEKLGKKSSRGSKWSKQTISSALKTWFGCGTSGYKVLLSQNYPLPSVRTLQESSSHIQFAPGVLNEVFDCLKAKVAAMSDFERDCCLTLDEISLNPDHIREFDPKGGSFVGSITVPNKDEVATHGLVFMLSGLTTRWKQTVAYHLTGKFTRGEYV